MGRPKGLLDVDGVPLVCHHARAFLAAGLKVTVVLGAHANLYTAALTDHFSAPFSCSIVYNPDWATTSMMDSLRIAFQTGTAIVTPIDVPPARAATLRALLACRGDAVPEHAGLPGHPVHLSSPPGPGERLDHRLARAVRVPVDDPDCLLNLNTPLEWARWRAG